MLGYLKACNGEGQILCARYRWEESLYVLYLLVFNTHIALIPKARGSKTVLKFKFVTVKKIYLLSKFLC